ncbi:MAG TPA: hypothetical protein VF622_17020, partial [Segetibacter sp.]
FEMNFKSILLISFVALTSCNGTDTKIDKDNYEKTKESLEEKEKKNPLSFLVVSGSEKRNFLGKTVINGTIENKASVCSYKEVRIKMLYYKEGTLVANHEQVLDEVVKASSSLNFKTRYFTPKGTDSVALSIMSAQAVKE